MKALDLVYLLADAVKRHGNLEVTGNAGFVKEVRVTPCSGGVSYPLPEEGPNELHLEFIETEEP